MDQLKLDLQPLPDYRTIPLTRGMFAIVDASDHEWLSQWKWYASKHRNLYYAKRGIVLPDGTRKTSYMHRELVGAPSDLQVDHKDLNSLNNQRSNLRLATHAQNKQNHGLSKNNTSGYSGVSWHKKEAAGFHWRARISINGKETRLGVFRTAEEAHRVREAAAKKFYGEFHNSDQ